MDVMEGLVDRVRMFMASYGAETCKPTNLWTNQEDSQELGLPLDPHFVPSIQTATSHVDAAGVTRYTGIGDLKGTQSYPWKFGDVVSSNHL